MVILHVKPCGRAGRLPSVTRAHIIDWVRSPNFISWFLKLSCEGAYHLVKRSIRAVTVTYLDKLWKVRFSVFGNTVIKKKIEYDYTGVIDFKSITPFCASSDERRHGKFTVVLARAVNFIWVLEERRDNARMKFWHMSCSRSNEPCKLECACTNSSLYGECP